VQIGTPILCLSSSLLGICACDVNSASYRPVILLGKICIVVYRVPATGAWSPRIAYRQSLLLADMWHAYWAVGKVAPGSKPSSLD